MVTAARGAGGVPELPETSWAKLTSWLMEVAESALAITVLLPEPRPTAMG